jgi:Aspartyl/Asparaginyl beta-hydroxylase
MISSFVDSVINTDGNTDGYAKRMRLPETFYRLPHLFDAERLAAEVMAYARSDWRPHPGGFEANSALILISANGGQNDSFSAGGPMMPTPALFRSPYLVQVLASLGLPLSRSRLMQIDAGKQAPLHDDVHLHWFRRVRVHIPIITTPRVRFSCADDSVYMGPGECWIFDNFELHRVENDSAIDRIHLCVDVAGDALLEKYRLEAIPISRRAAWGQPGHVRHVPYRPGASDDIACEADQIDLLSPADLDGLAEELAEIEAALASDARAATAWRTSLDAFRTSWAATYRELAHTRNNLHRFAAPIRAWVAEVERIAAECPVARDLDLEKNRKKARSADAYRLIRSMLLVTAEGWSTAR